MSRGLILSGVALWAGAWLLLTEIRWVSRPRLVDRLRPFSPVGRTPERSGPATGSVRAVVEPLAASLGSAVTRLTGRGDDLALRLARIHSPLDASGFRVRQLGWAAGGVGLATLLGAAVRLRAPILASCLAMGAVAGYALAEQRLSAACRVWERRRTLELPVVAEQLAMLCAAGFSLGSSLARVAARGRGVCALDLARVCGRIRQGLSEREALSEWAATARSAPVDRLVAVLCLSGETTDLGRLLSEEARAIRRQVQRQSVELMDRRSQQVWIPVTVAALVPGVVLLAVPFVQALRLFAGG